MRHVPFVLAAAFAASLAATPGAAAPPGSAAMSGQHAQEAGQERRSLHSSRRSARDREWAEGRVRLNCLVLEDHRLGDCRIVIESPSRRGAGDEAIRLAESYPPDPARRVGSRVNLRLNVALPD